MVEGGWWLLSFLLGVEPAGRRKSGVGLGDGGVKVDMWAAGEWVLFLVMMEFQEDDDGECFCSGERNGDGNASKRMGGMVMKASTTNSGARMKVECWDLMRRGKIEWVVQRIVDMEKADEVAFRQGGL
ncbi:hypothetical protein Dimus_008756 [Dionaea muscipula]